MSSVNDGISSEHSTVSYCRVDDAIALIKSLGRGCFLAKTDIKSAFRIVPIRPQDCPLLGMTWQGKYYYDRAMPMGCASSCRTFEMFSSALEWVAKKHLHIEHLVHILDDYLMAASSYHSAALLCEILFHFVITWVCQLRRQKLSALKPFWFLSWIRIRWRLGYQMIR